MKKKNLIVTGIILTILVVTGLVTSYADSARVRNGVEPKFVIKITTEGKNALSLTKEILPGILKLKADNIFINRFIALCYIVCKRFRLLLLGAVPYLYPLFLLFSLLYILS